MFLLGMNGMPRRVADYAPFRDWGTLNLIATVGAFKIVASLLLFVVNLVRSLRAGAPAGRDPHVEAARAAGRTV